MTQRVTLSTVREDLYIQTIKVVRTWTVLSLKEAKDAVDRVRSGAPETFLVANKKVAGSFVRDLNAAGATAHVGSATPKKKVVNDPDLVAAAQAVLDRLESDGNGGCGVGHARPCPELVPDRDDAQGARQGRCAMMYYLYARWPGQKVMRPVNWRKGTREVNLVYATRFTEEDRVKVEADLAHPENASITYEWREIPGTREPDMFVFEVEGGPKCISCGVAWNTIDATGMCRMCRAPVREIAR